MIKLTRLNNHIVAINPDHIGWADATPDTTLFMIGGEKIIVRETLDELIGQIIEFRRRVRMTEPSGDRLGATPRVALSVQEIVVERRGGSRRGTAR